MLANALLSVAALRLEKKFPDKVATSPIRISSAWLVPCGIASALLSAVFGVLACTFYWPVACWLAAFAAAALFISRRGAGPRAQAGIETSGGPDPR
jgi:hypothetical protein